MRNTARSGFVNCIIWVVATVICLAQPCGAQINRTRETPAEWVDLRWPNLLKNVERTLRYHPADGGFVITNGLEFFNRPLYCNRGAMRVDAGDKPEFVFLLPVKGGNLRFGITTPSRACWLHDTTNVVSFYEPGRMRYIIVGPYGEKIELVVIPLANLEGIIFKVELVEGAGLDLVWSFGGASGQRFRRNADIGCEAAPVNVLLQLRPEFCTNNHFKFTERAFLVTSPRVSLVGAVSKTTKMFVANAHEWNSLVGLLLSTNHAVSLPVLIGRVHLLNAEPYYLVICRSQFSNELAEVEKRWPLEEMEKAFEMAETRRQRIIKRVEIDCPDQFIQLAVSALNIAAEAIWDETTRSYFHGAVAWRVPLLGWRGLYAGDALGQHERTFLHILRYVQTQNTNPIPETFPGPDEDSNLSRCERALHSNGNMTRSHYDMNLVAVDGLIRHVRWTGELEKIREYWPVLMRHFAWEKRLFRRQFGQEKLPLYEAYACIWASDNLQYNGGGVTHSTAYNYLAFKTLGEWGVRFGLEGAEELLHEAERIYRAAESLLWSSDTGCYAEYRDVIGDQLLHTNAALWTVYHAIDSELGSSLKHWLMTRYVDTQIPHIPVIGPGIPKEDLYVLSTTSWMPYMWSVNNIVVAECLHMALAYWQANRVDRAFPLFKGAIISTMYSGLCPGNIGMTLSYDVARREAQRDFADGIGVAARAIVEGLVGVRPNLPGGEIVIVPGWPDSWQWLHFNHPDFRLDFRKNAEESSYKFTSRFPHPARIKFRLSARTSRPCLLKQGVSGAQLLVDTNSVGHPMIEVIFPPTNFCSFSIRWDGDSCEKISRVYRVPAGGKITIRPKKAIINGFDDPQDVLSKSRITSHEASFNLKSGVGGYKTLFVNLVQDELGWWEPISIEIIPRTNRVLGIEFDWTVPIKPNARLRTVDLSQFYNEQLSRIFENEYLSPRSPFCSLSIPKQGIGGWCDFNLKPTIDDSGLRNLAAIREGIFTMPNGIPFLISTQANAPNVVFVSKWDNYPNSVTIPLSGRAKWCFLFMVGTTTHMQSRFVNGHIKIAYKDGKLTDVDLENPVNWWPIEQDYFIDDFAFMRPEAIPPRVNLKSGIVRVLDPVAFKGKGGHVPGGAGTVLAIPLYPSSELKNLTVSASANEVIIGLLGVTLME